MALSSPLPELSRAARAAYCRARDHEVCLREELQLLDAGKVSTNVAELRSGFFPRRSSGEIAREGE